MIRTRYLRWEMNKKFSGDFACAWISICALPNWEHKCLSYRVFNIWAAKSVSQHRIKGHCRDRIKICLSSFLSRPVYSLIPCQSCAWHEVDIRPPYSTAPSILATVLVLEWPQLAKCQFVGFTLTNSGRCLLSVVGYQFHLTKWLFNISCSVSFAPGFMPFHSFPSNRKHPLEQKYFDGLLLIVKLMKVWMLGFVNRYGVFFKKRKVITSSKVLMTQTHY